MDGAKNVRFNLVVAVAIITATVNSKIYSAGHQPRPHRANYSFSSSTAVIIVNINQQLAG